MAQFIPADITQPQKEVTPKNGKHFDIREFYQLLNCSRVGYMTLPDGRVLVYSQEARGELNPRRNHRAGEQVVFVSLREVKRQIEEYERRGIAVYHNYDFSGDLDQPADFIAGDVVICESEEVN